MNQRALIASAAASLMTLALVASPAAAAEKEKCFVSHASKLHSEVLYFRIETFCGRICTPFVKIVENVIIMIRDGIFKY